MHADLTRTQIGLFAAGLGLIVAGAATIYTGPQPRLEARSAFTAPELAAHWPVGQVVRTLPARITGPRFVVGDSLAWRWPSEANVFALHQATSAEVRRAVLQLPRTGPVDELIVWLGSDEIGSGRRAATLVADVAAIVGYVRPRTYAVITPQPVWTSQLSVATQYELVSALQQRFPGRVVDPYFMLQAGLSVRAPVYYDDFQLTTVGYDHVRNQVEVLFGYAQDRLSFTHGLAEFGAMQDSMPVGIFQDSASGNFQDAPAPAAGSPPPAG